MSLRNADYTDLELLHVIASVAGPKGISTSADVAAQLGIKDKEGLRTPAGQVSSRLSWMQRYGYLDRLDPALHGYHRKEALWAITPIGRELMTGRRFATVERVVQGRAGDQLLVMRDLMKAGFIEGRAPVAAALRREFLHNAGRRAR